MRGSAAAISGITAAAVAEQMEEEEHKRERKILWMYERKRQTPVTRVCCVLCLIFDFVSLTPHVQMNSSSFTQALYIKIP